MREIQNNQRESKVSLPCLKETSFKGVKNFTQKAVIYETITLKDGDWVGLDNGLIRVNNARYNPKYYELIPHNETQRAVIQSIIPQPQKPIKVKTPELQKEITVSVDFELKSLNTIGLLINKIRAWQKHSDRLKETKNEDEIFLLGKKIKSEREYIEKYLNSLKADKNFSHQENYFVYSGQFVTAKKKIPEGGF